MNENELEQIKVDVSGWYAICNANEEVEAIFPTENYAVWYLEEHGWTNWKICRISGATAEDLFSSE